MEKVRLGDITICHDNKRKPLSSIQRNEIKTGQLYPYYGANKLMDYVNDYLFDGEFLCVAEDGGAWGIGQQCAYMINGKSWVNNHAHVLTARKGYDIHLLKYFLNYINLNQFISGAVVRKLTRGALDSIQVPNYDLQTQQKIVAELDSLSDIIEKKKEQLKELDNLSQSLFHEMFGDMENNSKNWIIKVWSNIINIKNGKNQTKVEDKNGKYPIYGSGGKMAYANSYICAENSVIIGRKGNINKPILVRSKFWNVDTAFGLEPNIKYINVEYLFQFCILFNFEKLNKAVTIPSLTKSDLLKIKIPVPPMELQNEFANRVETIDKQKDLINKSLVEVQTLFDSRMQKYFGE